MKKRTEGYFEEFFIRFPNLKNLEEKLKVATLELAKDADYKKILLCGNGGSASDCEHISGELLKSFLLKRKVAPELKQGLISLYGEEGGKIADNLQGGLKCIPLPSLNSALTAFLNDCNGDYAYAQLVNSLGAEGDCLIAISTSGNAKNVCLASKTAKAKGIKVIALTGKNGGDLKDIADILINVPETETYLVQELHLPIYHLICKAIESEIFD